MGPLEQEKPGDVRFLLVHHTASSNSYDREDVPTLIRSFYELHTGPEKKWPDVAYNFFVDRFGEVWEGRAGSIAGPTKADATGGSQGYAMLCCFIGDHQIETPTGDAERSMIKLLATMADRYRIDTSVGATTSFVSRGSNIWPRGVTVTTPTLAGHRDMSNTACPGDAAYELVQTKFPAAVSERRTTHGPREKPDVPEAAEPLPTPQESPPGKDWEALAIVAGGAAAVAGVAVLVKAATHRSAPQTEARRPEQDGVDRSQVANTRTRRDMAGDTFEAVESTHSPHEMPWSVQGEAFRATSPDDRLAQRRSIRKEQEG
jgi:hypothetical protein